MAPPARTPGDSSSRSSSECADLAATLQPLTAPGSPAPPPSSSSLASLRSRSLAQAQDSLLYARTAPSHSQGHARQGVSIPPQPRRPALAHDVTSLANRLSSMGLGQPPQQQQQQPQQQQPQSYAAAAAAAGASTPGQQQGQGQGPPGPGGAGSPQPPPRPKQTVYTFPSPPPDTADLLSELEEFYSYVEVPQVLEHAEAWRDFWDGELEFTKSPTSAQHAAIHSLLSTLNSSTSSLSTRQRCARSLLHLAHGSFGPGISTSPEHHLHLILSNCRVLRAAGALRGVWNALKRTGQEWDDASALSAAHAAAQAGGGGEDDEGEYPNAGAAPELRFSGPSDELDEERERERQERLDEINAELALLLAVLYFLVECFRGEEEWGEELMQLDPPMPVYLYNLVAGLREKNAKGYPVKKLLLLLWKSMLCTLGGVKDANRVKVLVREVEGLPKDEQGDRPDYRPWTKSSPPDLLTFRNETFAKYPSYTLPPPGALLPLPPPLSALGEHPQTLDRLSAAAAPTPVRPTFSYHVNANHDPSLPSNLPPPPPAAQWPYQQPPTPAPSPPPSPAPALHGAPTGPPQHNGFPPSAVGPPGGPPVGGKPKKQQFQTDQTRPFPLPFAPANASRGRAVPRAIEEAGELYRRHLRVSTELWQAWKVREEFGNDELGLTRAEEVEQDLVRREQERRRLRERELAGGEVGRKARALGRRLEQLVIGDAGAKKVARSQSLFAADSDNVSVASSVRGGAKGKVSDEDDEVAVASDDEDDGEGGGDPMDPLTVLRMLGRQVRRDWMNEEDPKRKKELDVRRQDIKRLERVEILYRDTLSQLQSAVIVLLKLLLATVTANQNLPPGQPGAEPTSSEPPPDLSLEDCDILRHREITSKAVSAILILTLKWFKTSHVMKFHYFSQLLVDSNCLLLILKMFGMQEVSTLVRIRHDRPEHNFFRFCHAYCNPGSDSPRPEDALLAHPPPGARPSSVGSNDSASGSGGAANGTSSAGGSSTEGDEIELVSDYSWRNFFSTVNFVHILQKLTKRKTHRVLLMVQYKSSAILKRILKVAHPTLQLYVLKVLKSQVPYCGRKWRQSNMKVITAIYLHVRPDLRDEWLAGVDVDADVEESLPHEQALRSLVRFFNTQHYSTHAPGLHRRSSSLVQGNLPSDPSPDFNPGPVASVPLPPLSPHGPLPDGQGLNDVFPPPRSLASIDVGADVPLQLAYGAIDPADDLGAFEVDDLLRVGSGGSLDPRRPGAAHESLVVGGMGPAGLGLGPGHGADGLALDDDDDGGVLDWLNDPLGASDAAWERLGLEGYDGEWDDVSDSESVGAQWGLLRFGVEGMTGVGGASVGTNGTASDEGDEVLDQRTSRNEWEHISPETITALEEERAAARVPNSPRPSRRRSSTGPVSPALRPVLIDRDDDGAGASAAEGSALVDGGEAAEEGPVPTVPHAGPAIDEVELIFHR